MYKVFLARRYMFVRPVSYLSMLVIGSAIAALIVVWSVMDGFLAETRELIRGTTADIVVTVLQSPEEPLERASLERVIRSTPGVTGAVSRLVRPAIFKVHGRDNLNIGTTMWADLNMVLVLGIDAEAEFEVTDLRDHLTEVDLESQQVDDPDTPFKIARNRILDRRLRMAALPRLLMGWELMDQLGLSKGDAIDLVTVPDNVAMFESDQLSSSSETFIVAGAFSTGHHESDMSRIMLSSDAFRRWSKTFHEVSEVYVSVALDGVDELAAIRGDLEAAFDAAGFTSRQVIVESWRDRHRILLGAVENERNILFIVLGMFVLLTCLITFAVLWTLVQEKTRDIGILSTMGAAPLGVGGLFTLCGTLISAAGCVVGLVLGTLIVVNVNAIKDWIENTFGVEIFRRDVYAFTEIPAKLDHGLNLMIVVVTIFFSALICLWPAWRAGRMNPVEALRHE